MARKHLNHLLVSATVIALAGVASAQNKGELIQPEPTTIAADPAAQTLDGAAFRVRFGLRDADPTDWSGTVEVAGGGRVAGISGWRWAQGDHATGPAAWTARTRRQAPQNPAAASRQAQNGRQLPVDDAGVIVRLLDTSADSTVSAKTAAGDFTFKPDGIAYGERVNALNGGATIERVPPVAIATATTDDEDYPAAVRAADGTVYAAFVSFTRGKDFPGARERVAALGVAPEGVAAGGGGTNIRKIDKPADLEYLREPSGGDRVLLKTFKDGKWSASIDVSAKTGAEFYRPAIAVDGAGTVWVFYSTHQDTNATLDEGNWELLARSFDPATGQLGDAINLSNAPGSDFQPAATTDSNGRTWVTWIGGREVNFDVFVANQIEAGKPGFTAARRVTTATANEWEPAIAADKAGHVTVGWDTYAKGDYDVLVATFDANATVSAEPVPVAASLKFEGRPSLAYDAAGKLWVAYEVGGDGWGKDFGALKKVGVPLYSGNRTVAAKVYDPAAKQWFAPPDLTDAIGGRVTNDLTTTRPFAGLGPAARARAGTAPCYPRIGVDDAGNVWLAFRGRQNGNWRVGIGSVWFEFVTRLDGDKWVPSTWLLRSNNVLDNRPALLAWAGGSGGGGSLLLYSGDSRGEVAQQGGLDDPHMPSGEVAATSADAAAGDDAAAPATTRPSAGAATAAGAVVGAGGNQNGAGRRNNSAGPDANDNLYVAALRSDAWPKAPALTPIPAEVPATPIQRTADENDAVRTARASEVTLNGETLTTWRGEFHRHTEFSPDGGADGGLLDMWRYALDAVNFDWIGDGDHDYGNGREYSWWTTQKAVSIFTIPNHFTPVYSYERSVPFPEGHRNVMLPYRGVRSLPRLPLSAVGDGDKPAADTQLLYQYLHYFGGITAAHTTATDMGTDWRNNDPEVEPFVEVYQGDRNNYERPDAPRSAPSEAQKKGTTPAQESIGGWRPKGFINLALLKGYRLAFESSSDHVSTHLSYCNVMVTDKTRQGIVDAIKKRRVYGSTDNILADVRVHAGGVDHLFGEEFSTSDPITLRIHLVGAQTLADVEIIKDDQVVKTFTPNEKDVKLEWTDPSPTPGKTSYYYVRGQQVPDADGAEGELVWVSPFWIKYEAR